MNILFVISDDLSTSALGSYGNKLCKTPNIDKFADQGTRFTRAYSQATSCGPSRASMMFSYYMQASGSTGYVSGRAAIGDTRDSWPQYFRKNGYYSTRVSKIFHMGVPIDIQKGNDGSDDAESWDEKYNSQAAEASLKGDAELLQNNPKEIKKTAGGNKFVNVASEANELLYSDGVTAKKAVELIHQFKTTDKPSSSGICTTTCSLCGTQTIF